MLTETHMFVVFNSFAFFVTFAFVLEDPYLAGIEMVLKSPNAIGIMLFIAMTLWIKMHLKLVCQFYVSKDSDSNQSYQTIEDKLFMEEYEDPKQSFQINQFGNYKELARSIEANKLFAIN